MEDSIDIQADLKSTAALLLKRISVLELAGTLFQSQPLGFMRLALDGQKNNEPGHFLHVWMPGLPTQKHGPFRHTHVFDLESKVLIGKIKNTIYNPKANVEGEYQLVGATCAQDFCLPAKDTQGAVDLEISDTFEISQGATYQVLKGKFHDTTVIGDGVALTLIRKYNVEQKDPILAIPTGVAIPTNTFNRNQIDQDFAWLQIRKLLETLI